MEDGCLPKLGMVFVKKPFQKPIPLVWTCWPRKNIVEILFKRLICILWVRIFPDLSKVDRSSPDSKILFNPIDKTIECILAGGVSNRPVVTWD